SAAILALGLLRYRTRRVACPLRKNGARARQGCQCQSNGGGFQKSLHSSLLSTPADQLASHSALLEIVPFESCVSPAIVLAELVICRRVGPTYVGCSTNDGLSYQ